MTIQCRNATLSRKDGNLSMQEVTKWQLNYIKIL